jgi:hypothetical protein
VIEGSRLAGPIHESLGAQNPRLMRSFAGGDLYRVEYMIDFDSFEACGAFTDAMLGHEWFVQMTANVAAAYPELKKLRNPLRLHHDVTSAVAAAQHSA